MIRFIWKNWWRNKERFILLLVGVFIISSGLSYLVGIQETNRGTIEEMLQKRWTSTYHIVVRPTDTRSVTEENGLLEPNFLNGISGGISNEQYETIKRLDDVSVAAPVAVIGYTNSSITFDKQYDEQSDKFDKLYDVITDPGIYRVDINIVTNNGVKERSRFAWTYYITRGDSFTPRDERSIEYGVSANTPVIELGAITNQLLVAIDPDQEAKLIGLDQAVLTQGKGRYFRETDKPFELKRQFYDATSFPILVSNQSFNNETYQYEIEKLELPFTDDKTIEETMTMVKKNGGREYLHTIKGNPVFSSTHTSDEAHHIYIKHLSGVDPLTGEKPLPDRTDADFGAWITAKTTPLELKNAKSPFPDKWPYAFEVVKQESIPNLPNAEPEPIDTYRKLEMYSRDWENSPKIAPYFIGFYDPSLLIISKDPLTELPMETYRPAEASLVLDANGNPQNPKKTIKPTGEVEGLLTSPPVLLTTLDAAGYIMGDQAISAIRVKVDGVDNFSEESQKKLEEVAREIEEKTGLITDITLGSSPQTSLVYVPEVHEQEALGWIEQPWIKLGASIGIFTESKIGFTAIIAIVLVVAIVYVFSTNFVTFLSRRKELAILLSVGWRPGHLVQLVFLEAALVGTLVSIIAWMMQGLVLLTTNNPIAIEKFVLIGLIGFSIYLLGAIGPAVMSFKITPYEAIKTGEITKNAIRLLQVRGIFQMAVGHFAGKWKRNLLSIFSIALPTMLLTFFLFVTFRLKGMFYTTWLGEYVVMEVGPAHYVAMAIVLLIALLITGEITWQNVSERKSEVALLKSIGWRDNAVRKVILLEGVLSGIIAGFFGIGAGVLMIQLIYKEFPLSDVLWVVPIFFIPVFVGLLGAILPAEKAVRTTVIQGIRGGYSKSKGVENKFKVVLAILIFISMLGVAATFIKLLPDRTIPTSNTNLPAEMIEEGQK